MSSLHQLPEYVRLTDGHKVRAGRVTAFRGGRLELSTKPHGRKPSEGQGYPLVPCGFIPTPPPAIGDWIVVDSKSIVAVPEGEFDLAYLLNVTRLAA